MSTHALPRRADTPETAGLDWFRVPGMRAGLVLWGGLALVDLGHTTRLPSYAGLGAVALLVMAAAVGMRPRVALVLAGIGWLVVDGFVVHRYGVLAVDGAPDAGRLALLVALATLASRARR